MIEGKFHWVYDPDQWLDLVGHHFSWRFGSQKVIPLLACLRK